MTDLEAQMPDHDRISAEVRMRSAARLERLLQKMDMFLEDDPRDFSASQLAVYLQAVRLLGDLYQVRERPNDSDSMISVERAEKLAALRAQEAAELAVAAERERVAEQSRMALESGGSRLRETLDALRDRMSGGDQNTVDVSDVPGSGEDGESKVA